MGDGAASREEMEAEEAESDAEAVEREWHAWVAGMIIVGGVALIIAPNHFLPELLLGVGPLLVILGVVGWVIQWSYKRYLR